MSELTFAEPQRVNTQPTAAKEPVSLERCETNLQEPTALRQWRLDTLTGTFAEPRIGFDFSRVAALTGMERENRPLLHTPVMIQQSPKDGDAGTSPCPYCPEAGTDEITGTAESEAETTSPAEATGPTTEPPTPGSEPVSEPVPGTEPGAEAAVPGKKPAAALIVEDSTEELGPGQMRKSEFLAKLRAEVSRTVDAAIAETGRDTEGCPYLQHWFDFYQRQDSVHVERAIRRYAPETARSAIAAEYIPIITERARRSAEVWARTGKITGIPEGLPMGTPGMGLLGSVGRMFSGMGSMFFKARDGGARRSDDPRAIQAKLGEGRPLDSGVRSRMETAFGMDFSHVRTHTDTGAAKLSNNLNARAFTVGKHVAFGDGEYKPGTLVGDALLAHELAHVVQQDSGNPSIAPMQGDDAAYNSLEHDADQSAAGVITSLWNGVKGYRIDISHNSITHISTGLRLQRCNQGQETPSEKQPVKNEKPLVDFDKKDVVNKVKKALKSITTEIQLIDIINDMWESGDQLYYETIDDIIEEVKKRALTAKYMRMSQGSTVINKGFSYPDRKKDNTLGCESKVNDDAKDYWEKITCDKYYCFKLSDKGKEKPYTALVKLFTEHPKKNACKRTLIHCDYLYTVIAMRSHAETIGEEKFNSLVKEGKIVLVLRWDGFRSLIGTSEKPDKTVSLQEIEVANEKDLIIGDHCIFYNHETYDCLNENKKHPWRLENAVITVRKNGKNRYQGHGYFSPVTKVHMYNGMLGQYNKLVNEAKKNINDSEKLKEFNVKKENNQYFIEGKGLCGKQVKRKLSTINLTDIDIDNDKMKYEEDSKFLGLRDPCSGKIKVRRPIESGR